MRIYFINKSPAFSHCRLLGIMLPPFKGGVGRVVYLTTTFLLFSPFRMMFTPFFGASRRVPLML